MADYISKQEFSRRCGVSVPTVYAWIDKDRDGIKEYIKGAKIDARIFTAKPWSAYQSAGDVEAEKIRERAAELSAELEKIRGEMDAQRAELESAAQTIRAQAEQIAAKDQHIADMRAQIAAKDGQIQALLVTMNKQLQALPAPRRPFWERWAERRAAKKAEQPHDDNAGV